MSPRRPPVVMVNIMTETLKPTQCWQSLCVLTPKPRGFHLITDKIVQTIGVMPAIQTGLIHLFLQHTSASLTISENTCNDVPLDLETCFDALAPDDSSLYRHTLEGDDDMPAHIKSTLLGVSLVIPIGDTKLLLGQWQGIYLCEHRNHATARRIIITAQGIFS